MKEQLKLSNQICFPFYAISRKITKIYYPMLKDIDLTYPQYLVMMILWEKDNILIKDICSKLFLDTNTVSPLLDKLLEKGLISKHKTYNNAKEVRVILTNKWSGLSLQASNIPNNLLNEFDFDSDYLKELHSNLWKLLDIIDSKSNKN